MVHLFQLLGERVTEWQKQDYPSDYPAISEILEYARIPETDSLRFLRAAQLKALEIYWYLRLVEKTPKVFDLYSKYFPMPSDRFKALGIEGTNEEVLRLVFDRGADYLFERIRTDDEFASRMKFEALRESMTLDYPSYILALAMGAGKTILIGAIIATEFAMAMEYPEPEGGQQFIRNALVFAPGKTILGALKEIADIPFEKILPPRFIKTFNASLKLTFTQDGVKDLPIIRKSSYNLIVTNTEKIRIQKSTGVRRSNGSQKIFGFDEKDAEESEVANLRLQALASLPKLGIFSDEAHHTYGQSLEADLKKVRKTVDYLHENTDVVCVVNTTGTPYYQKQPLKDVVTWYGLSQGIRDNVLKDVSGDNIKSYTETDSNPELFLSDVLTDFFGNYRDVSLPDGAKAKIAIYFPQEEDLVELKGVIEKTLSQLHLPLTTILKNTSKSSAEEIADFDRLNDPTSQHRVILLVNKGTEGWNCPSLFATVLARKLKTSNNFVLQAGTRCLRQVVGNSVKASIYLSEDNRKILDSQLQETFGETLRDLSNAKQNTAKATITLRKLNMPKLVIKKLVRAIVEKAEAEQAKQELSFVMPKPEGDGAAMIKKTFRAEKSDATKSILQQQGQSEIGTEDDTTDLRLLATEFAANFHLDNLTVYDSLKNLYGTADEVPLSHREALAQQLTDKLKIYEVKDQVVEEALALVKPEGFDKQGDDENAIYTAEISYPKSREDVVILQMEQAAKENPNGFGFHFTPYNFDTSPERDFFVKMLAKLNTTPEEVEDFLFTGGITAPNKTDFYVEYKGEDGKWHNYFPDFIIRKRDGKCLIVEIKRADRVNDASDGRNGRKAMAIRKWEDLNPDRLKYEMIFADETVAYNDLQAAYDTFNRL